VIGVAFGFPSTTRAEEEESAAEASQTASDVEDAIREVDEKTKEVIPSELRIEFQEERLSDHLQHRAQDRLGVLSSQPAGFDVSTRLDQTNSGVGDPTRADALPRYHVCLFSR
jgi:hypothetical protein